MEMTQQKKEDLKHSVLRCVTADRFLSNGPIHDHISPGDASKEIHGIKIVDLALINYPQCRFVDEDRN